MAACAVTGSTVRRTRISIAADESVRAWREHVRWAQLAATGARLKREQTELEAEGRVAARRREALAVEAQAVEAVLVPAFDRAEKLADAAEQLSPWGSPAARRIGLCGGMGCGAKELFGARGQVHRLGAHTIGGSLLPEQYAPDGNTWGRWRKQTVALGPLADGGPVMFPEPAGLWRSSAALAALTVTSFDPGAGDPEGVRQRPTVPLLWQRDVIAFRLVAVPFGLDFPDLLDLLLPP